MSHLVTVSGEATIFQAADLHRTLLDALAQEEALRVDLSQITEFDCSAAQILIWLTREGARLGRPVSLLSPGEPVRELLALIGLDAELTFEETAQ
ncbi:STAS domain-containing protein [Paludibacterium yongneupense]|uniref:STAS domain-containing protein n=1 Tax=Paludibacterium yongneupense TaxID=400061 RepID=UPI00041C34C1|nr:STAS domain-containing protein [Paludibacterium yongneupense]